MQTTPQQCAFLRAFEKNYTFKSVRRQQKRILWWHKRISLRLPHTPTHTHKHAYVQLCVLNKLLLAFFYSISHYIFISTFLSLSFCNLFFGNSFLAHFYLNFQVVLFARYHCFFVAYSFSALCLMLSTPHLHMYLSGC